MPLTLQQKLDEAEAAYHKLMTGTMARVVVDKDGTRVEFTMSTAPRLYAYIQDLKTQLGLIGGTPPNYGPAGFVF